MKWQLSVLLLLICSVAYTQKKSLIGFNVNGTDFETPAKIRQTSLGHVLKDGFFGRMQPGFSISYWQGLTRHLDFSARYNGIFNSDDFVSGKPGTKDYLNELEGAFHLRAFSDDKIVNPFLTAGAGIGNYWKNTGVAGYVPLGVGVQFNLMQETYIFLQSNFRWSFNTSQLPNNLFYSFGITESIFSHKKKSAPVPVILPVQENKDRDNDGVQNDLDECPDVAGTVNGCPDSDNDQIADKDDRCPQLAGVIKYKGCPIPDSDKDGINDEEDECPGIAGTGKYKGCPVPDRDNDGINDEDDKCPDVAGNVLNRGCPEIKKEVIEKVNKTAQSIYFITGKDVIDKRSYKSLNNLAALMQGDGTLQLIVEGHTDNTGREATNQALSEKRAAAIKNYLIKKGVSEERVATMGYGSSRPVGDNKTIAGRAKNRRVEMSIRNY